MSSFSLPRSRWLVCLLALGGPVASAAPQASPGALAPDSRIILVRPAGESREEREIGRWQDQIRREPAKADNYERLGWVYIALARRTLDAGYYKLAEKTAEVMEGRCGPSDEASLLRGHVDHNLHRFAEAEQVARQLTAHRGAAFDYALLSDALMEQGKITEAVAACQRMMALKPGLEAYSRAAHLRWLTGDLAGAISAMEAAARAGSPLDATNSAWTLTRLSGYYLQAGDTSAALRAAESAAHFVADYPPALLARGRALLALGQTAAAIGPLERAERLNPLPEYQWWLADALRAGGRAAEAGRMETALAQRGTMADPRTLALYLSTRGQTPDEAVRLAQAELGHRADVLTQDALAWSLAAAGDYGRAETAMRAALAAQTRDARLFLHAGRIALDCGRPEAAQAYFSAAEKYAATLTPSERALLERSRRGAAAGG